MESLEVILAAWTDRASRHSGSVLPGARRGGLAAARNSGPHPPVWVSVASSPASFEQTARRGYNALTLGFPRPVTAFAELTRAIETHGSTAAATRRVINWQPCTTHRMRERRARPRAGDHPLRPLPGGPAASAARPTRRPQPPRAASGLTDLDVGALIDQARVIAGNPQEVVDMLRYLQGEVGFTQLNHMFQFGGLGFEVAHESMALFAQEVMPKLRAPRGPTGPRLK